MAPFNRLLNFMLRPWIAGSYVAFVFLSFYYFDKPLAYYFHDLSLKAAFPVLHWVTCLGEGLVYIGTFFILALIFRYVYRNKIRETRCWFLWLCVLVPNLISLVLKILLGRARPELLFDENLYGFYGFHTNHLYWSFPSGHASAIVGLVLGLSIVFPRYFYLCLLSGLLIISTRVFLTNHYLSDVMATSYLVLLEIGLLSLCLRRKQWLIFQDLRA